jgi:tRNA (guanosine-2'-O-)-methyltransferase
VNPDRFARLSRVLNARQPDLSVVMEGVHKPHNLSAVLRSCDAAGVLELHAVVPAGDFNVSHGTSGGSRKWVRTVTHETTTDAVDQLRDRGFQLIAAHATEASRDYREVDYTVPTAFVVGAELFGLSHGALRLVDRMVVIPMVGMVESLNVSVATALLLFEAKRQRERKGMYARSRLSEDEHARILFEWTYPRIASRLAARGHPYPELTPTGEIADRNALLVLTGGDDSADDS